MTYPPIGARIELIAMPDDPAPIPSGTKGTVTRVTDTSFMKPGTSQISVDWDDGRGLMLVVPPDRFRVIKEDS